MSLELRTGRLAGALLLVQLAGLIVPFVLILPLTTGSREYLVGAAAAAGPIRLAVFLLFANCALTIGLTLVAVPVMRHHHQGMALALLAASVVLFVMQAVDNVHILSMLSLSERYIEAGGGDGMWPALAASVGATRRWAHLTTLLVLDGWIFLLYVILYRYALVPRGLAAFGVLTVLLHFTGVPLLGLLGLGMLPALAPSLVPSHLALGVWLMAKGFREGESGLAPLT